MLELKLRTKYNIPRCLLGSLGKKQKGFIMSVEKLSEIKDDIHKFVKYVCAVEILKNLDSISKPIRKHFNNKMYDNDDMLFRLVIENKNLQKSLGILQRYGLKLENYYIDNRPEDFMADKYIKMNRSDVFIYFPIATIPNKCFWYAMMYEAEAKSAKNAAKIWYQYVIEER